MEKLPVFFQDKSDSRELFKFIEKYFPPASPLPSRLFAIFVALVPDFLKAFKRFVALVFMIFIFLLGNGYLNLPQKSDNRPNVASLTYKELEVSKSEVFKNQPPIFLNAQGKVRVP
jgi:hypothetical protein